MNEKYELLKDPIINLYRIRALKDFSDIKAGTLGGYVENEDNLSNNGNAWIYGNAKVYGDARVYDDAKVYGNAWVYGNAIIYGNAKVCGDARVYDYAKVYGDARVYGDASIKSDLDYTTIKGFGSKQRTTTFFRCGDGLVRVVCGCFYGTLAEFRDKVIKTHGDSKYSKEYLMIADLMELHFSE